MAHQQKQHNINGRKKTKIVIKIILIECNIQSAGKRRKKTKQNEEEHELTETS